MSPDTELVDLLHRAKLKCYTHGLIGAGIGTTISYVLFKTSNFQPSQKILPYSLSLGLLSGVAICHYSLTMLRDRILFKQKWNAFIKAEERK